MEFEEFETAMHDIAQIVSLRKRLPFYAEGLAGKAFSVEKVVYRPEKELPFFKIRLAVDNSFVAGIVGHFHAGACPGVTGLMYHHTAEFEGHSTEFLRRFVFAAHEKGLAYLATGGVGKIEAFFRAAGFHTLRRKPEELAEQILSAGAVTPVVQDWRNYSKGSGFYGFLDLTNKPHREAVFRKLHLPISKITHDA